MGTKCRVLNPKPGDFCLQAGVNPVLVVSVDDFDVLIDDDARDCTVLHGTVFKRPRLSPFQRPHVDGVLGSYVPARWLTLAVTLPEQREVRCCL